MSHRRAPGFLDLKLVRPRSGTHAEGSFAVRVARRKYSKPFLSSHGLLFFVPAERGARYFKDARRRAEISKETDVFFVRRARVCPYVYGREWETDFRPGVIEVKRKSSALDRVRAVERHDNSFDCAKSSLVDAERGRSPRSDVLSGFSRVN